MSFTKNIFLVLLSTISSAFPLHAQTNKLSADDIVQQAIDRSGGTAKFDSIHAVEFITTFITPKDDTLSFAIKRKDYNKYFISTLSNSHVNSTKIYNNGSAVSITGETIQKITDEDMLEQLSLQCYISIDYGYKKLGYKLTRHDDQKFQNFDCYVVIAESPLGRKTLNYYDKKTGLLLMTIYPTGNKSIFIESYQLSGITSASEILLADTASQVSYSSVLTRTAEYNNSLDSNWFNIPKENIYQVPEKFKTGTFRYLNTDSAQISRDRTKQIETVKNIKLEYRIEWKDNSDYTIYTVKNGPKTVEPDIEYIRTRIVAWSGNKYYCHYLASNNIGGTCAFEKID